MNSPLALFGGTPVLPETGTHFSWPPITDATAKAVVDQLGASISVYDRSGVIADLEDALRDYFGVRHAVLTSSGTAALHSSYAASGIEPGDEVIVPAYTFFATATPLLHLGAVPVLADSDETGNVSVDDVAARITERTTAIVVTHLWGIPADLDGLSALADARGLALLEDASHAHGATVGGNKVGTFGHVGAFSMNGPKPLSAGEGGFALTDNDEVYYRLLLHGQYNKRCRSEITPAHPMHQYAVTGMGLKLRIHPLAARIALDQLDHLDYYLAGRARVAAYLCEQLGQLPGIAVPKIPDGTRPAWYGLPLIYVPDELDGVPVERTHQALHAEGLREVDRPGSTCPLNQLPLFQRPEVLFPHHPALDDLRYQPGQFPVAEQVHHHTLKLPVWYREDDLSLVERYVEGFRKVIEHHRDLRGQGMVDRSLLAELVTQADADGVQQLVVGGIVREGGSVLLLQRPDDDFMGGIFELPSGKVEPGEALDAALVREVKEETGLDVSGISHYLGHFDYTSGSGKPSRQFNFAVEVAAATPVVLQEHDAYRWAALEDELPVTDAVRQVFQAYREVRPT